MENRSRTSAIRRTSALIFPGAPNMPFAYSNCQFSKPHLKKGRRQRAEGRRKEDPDLSFCLLPPALCLKLTELWLAQVKTAVNVVKTGGG
jgi:hypothetical protein